MCNGTGTIKDFMNDKKQYKKSNRAEGIKFLGVKKPN